MEALQAAPGRRCWIPIPKSPSFHLPLVKFNLLLAPYPLSFLLSFRQANQHRSATALCIVPAYASFMDCYSIATPCKVAFNVSQRLTSVIKNNCHVLFAYHMNLLIRYEPMRYQTQSTALMQKPCKVTLDKYMDSCWNSKYMDFGLIGDASSRQLHAPTFLDHCIFFDEN